MDLNAVKESQETIANRIEGKILREEDFETFSIQTTMIYTHLTDEEMRNAVNNMDK